MAAPFPPLREPLVGTDRKATPFWATYFNLVGAAVTPIDNLPDALPASSLVGRSDSGDGVAEVLTLGSGLSIAGTVLSAASISGAPFANAALTVADTTGIFLLTWKPASALTASRIFSLATGDSDRTLTLSGNPTLGDWFDQSVKAAASPTFNGLTLTNLTTGSLTVNAFALTVNGAPTLNDWFDQSVKAAASPTFSALTVTNSVGAASYSVGGTPGDTASANLELNGGGSIQLTVVNGLVTVFA